MKEIKVLLFYIVILFDSNVAQPSMTISDTRNRFEIHISGRVSQIVDSPSEWPNKSATYEAKLDDLQLLRNTRIFAQHRGPCILSGRESINAGNQTRTSKENGNTSTKRITFVEIAKKLDIRHTHRNSMATRPRCIMDFIIPRLNSSKTVKLEGEFCVPEHLTGGAAIGDYDNDGLDDIFFAVFHSRSVLYRNNGNKTFTDVTRESGIGPARYANGAAWADVDQDGDLDLYVTTVGDTRHYLFINYGGRFEEEALTRDCSLQFPNVRKLAGMSANFGDFNNDGYPDLYVTEWIPHTLGKPSASRLLRNKGAVSPGHFEDVTEIYGVNMDEFKLEQYDLGSGTYSFASSFTDFDNDGRADLLVTADFGESRMFWNLGSKFWECTEYCGLKGEQDAMGHAIGDWNNDGKMDWFSTAIMDDKVKCWQAGCTFDSEGNRLYQNLGSRLFDDITSKAGVADGSWGWGAAFLDFNNDGYQDIVMTNGIDFPTTTTDDHFDSKRMRLWQNLGKGQDGKTKEVSQELGLNSTKQGRGLLKWDIDDDGDLDVVICNNVGHPEIYENQGGNKVNFWIRVKVMHKCQQEPRLLCESLGARIEVKQENTNLTQTQEIGSGTHFLTQSERTAHFGLGSKPNNVTVHVNWPATGFQLYVYNVPVNTKLQVVQPDSGIKNTTYSSLEACPTLKITEITKQPKQGRIEINSDHRTVHFVADQFGSLEAMEQQDFSYKLQVFPKGNNSVSVERSATIYAAGMDEECKNGKPIEYESLRSTDERRYDGVSNNKRHLMWGAVSENLRRRTSPAYSDGIATPASVCDAKQRLNDTCPYTQEYSSYGSTRPSPRLISNVLFRQSRSIISKRKINDFHVHFGQFLSHDTDLTTMLPRFEFQEHLNDVWLPITVPKGDVYFDLGNSDSSYLPFVRSIYNRCTGREAGTPRQQVNLISSYIDGNMIYGSDPERNKVLRTLSKGKLKVWENEMLPLNQFGAANSNDVGRKTKRLFLAGDTRANIQPGLTAVHTVFVREHNRLCDEYLKKRPNANDEEVFQHARKMVIAELQAVTFREYLPSLLGGSEDIPSYAYYDDRVDATTDHTMTTAAFRFGHSQINSLLWRLDEHGDAIPEGHLQLREAYFAPERIIHEGGIDPILRGSFKQPAQQVDTKVVDEVRSFLFAFNRRGQDLTSINIQRGRDHGVADLNNVRKNIGLPKYKSFNEITSDNEIASKLKELYHDVDNVDLWVGGLAEDHQKGELGPTFRKIILDSFLRIRDGDRFWYEQILSPEEIESVNNFTLSEIIRRNTNITHVPRHVFYSTKHCMDVEDEVCIPHPIPNETGPQELVENLEQTVLELRNKSAILESTLTRKDDENKDLTNRLTSLQQKYNSTLNITNEQTKERKISENEQMMELKFRIVVLVLIGVLFTTTVVCFVLYLRTKKECKRLHSQFSDDGFVKKITKTTAF